MPRGRQSRGNTCLPGLGSQAIRENRTLRDETSSLQGTKSVKKKSCWSLLNYPPSFEKVVSNPWRKEQALFDWGFLICMRCKHSLSRSSDSHAGLSEGTRDPGSQKQQLLQADACQASWEMEFGFLEAFMGQPCWAVVVFSYTAHSRQTETKTLQSLERQHLVCKGTESTCVGQKCAMESSGELPLTQGQLQKSGSYNCRLLSLQYWEE